jgi:predicted anti-sigma-YlaC factor YlaD
MLKCKEATRLMSEGLDRKLATGERIQLEMHLAICRGCRSFREQMTFLRSACQQLLKRTVGQNEQD